VEDEELQPAELPQKLDYKVHWHGITLAHVGILGGVTFIGSIATFAMPLVRMIPTWPILALGLSALTFIVIVQFRKDPEHYTATMERWRSPRRLSPFIEGRPHPDFPFSNIELSEAWREINR
jgi:hypothetical protein